MTAPSTSISAGLSLAGRVAGRLLSPAGARGKLTILTFHNVMRQGVLAAPGDLDQAQFRQIIDLVATMGQVLPLRDAVQALKANALPARAVVLTFDDGYADWLESVCPILLAHKLPATFFLSTDHLQGRAHWHDRVADAVGAMTADTAALPLGLGSLGMGIDTSDLASREMLISRLQRSLKYLNLTDRAAVIARLEALADKPIVPAPLLEQDAVRALAGMGFEIGAHTCSHPILTRCDAQESWHEIAQGRKTLEAVIDAPVLSFAYPNGRPNLDYAMEHVELVRRAGYVCAVTTAAGVANSNSDLFQLPRYAPWPASNARMTLQLASNLMHRRPAQALTAAQAEDAKRCLLVASTFPPIRGGSANVYGSLCASSPQGAMTALVASKDFSSGADVPRWQAHDARCNYSVVRLPYIRPPMLPPPKHSWQNLWRLLCFDLPIFFNVLVTAGRIVRSRKIGTVCIGEAVSGGWIGVVLKALLRVRLVVYVHGEEITTEYSGRLNLLGRAAVLRAADQIVAVSRFARDELIGRVGVPLEHITVIESGIDNERFTPGPRRGDLLDKHQLRGRKVVLSVGRLIERKGFDMALRAMPAVFSAVPDAHYMVVGTGPERPNVEALINELGLTAKVTLVGDVSDADLVDYFRICDVFLLPNRTLSNGDTEGFGLVFREANACGKAAIGGRAGGAVEAIIEGYNGLLVDGWNSADIAKAAVRLLQDDGERERLASNGLALARRAGVRQSAENFNRTCIWLQAAHRAGLRA